MPIDWNLLLSAVGLMLVFEGIMPAVFPNQWRNMVVQIARQQNRPIRIGGLVSMLTGALVIYLTKVG